MYTFKRTELAVEIEGGTDGVQGSSKSGAVESNKGRNTKDSEICKPRFSTETDKTRAIRFLLGRGEYAIWLKFWCNVAGIKVSSVKKYAEKLQGGNNGERTKIYYRR